jgi:hypothetical protein
LYFNSRQCAFYNDFFHYLENTKTSKKCAMLWLCLLHWSMHMNELSVQHSIELMSYYIYDFERFK